MGTKLVKLYDERELASFKRRRLVWIVLAAAAALAALVLCIFFMKKAVAMRSPAQLLRAVIASVAGGWMVLTLRIFAIDELSRGIKHIKAMLDEGSEETVVRGGFSAAKKPLRIKRGVALRRVSAENETLSLWERKVKRFPSEKAVAVRCVNGFITAYEVEDERD